VAREGVSRLRRENDLVLDCQGAAGILQVARRLWRSARESHDEIAERSDIAAAVDEIARLDPAFEAVDGAVFRDSGERDFQMQHACQGRRRAWKQLRV